MNKIFQKATRKALIGWEAELDTTELINELWGWYLERPYVQSKFDELSEAQLVQFSRRQAINLLSREAKDRDLFQARTMFSSEAVKNVLKGGRAGSYLATILPYAMSAMDKKNPGYAEALRSRYSDGKVPDSKSDQNKLTRAHKALTEHLNIIAITSGDGRGKPRLRKPVDPYNRSQGGVHSDPTANIAIMLLGHPELEEEVLFELPIRALLKGRGW